MSTQWEKIVPYIPPTLLDVVLTSGPSVHEAAPAGDPAVTGDVPAPGAQRFPAAVLFADVSGFTPLTEALAQQGAEGPEELNRLLNRYFDAMILLIEQQGGSVVKFSGDGITVLFVAQEESLGHATRRAQQAAVAMQAAMPKLASIKTSIGTITLGMKICIGAGQVVAMQVGGVLNRWEYVVAGGPLQQIAELGPRAHSGDVLLSPEAQVLLHPDPLLPRPLILPAPEAATANAISRLRRFVPGPVKGWLDGELYSWLPVLRPLSVLFAGLHGVDYEQYDIVQRLHHFLRAAQRVLYRYEGTLRQFLVDDKGTVLLALFGAPPFAHEDDAMRTARAALDLQLIAQAHGFHLAQGMATGHVFSGPVGSQSRCEYTAMGDTVNLAARLMAAAGPDNILCDFDTYRQAREQVIFTTLPPIRVKGKAGLIRVYRPLAQLLEPTPLDPEPEVPETTQRRHLVGRCAEIARLEQALDTLLAGESQILLIQGEAGIGKTRLVEALTRRIKEHGLVWLLGAGQSIEQSTPYRAWRDVLSFYFGLEQVQDQAEQRARILAMVRELAPEQERRLPLLNDVLNLGFADSELTASLDPQLRHQSLVTLVLALLRTWVTEHPLILILEDAHWLDSLSWELTVEVARSFTASQVPLLLVLAMRPLYDKRESQSHMLALQALPGAEVLPLERMAPEEIVQLVAQELDLAARALPPELAALVSRRAEGNPFFAEEIIFTLRQQGAIQLERSTEETSTTGVCCTLTTPLEQVAQTLPDTLQGLILTRVDRLPPERQLVLKAAAVIGRTFAYAPVRHILRQHMSLSAGDIKGHLAALEELDFIALNVAETELCYYFKHVIIQEVSYETLLFSQRRALHRSAAAWYEMALLPANSAPLLSPYLPLLVYHYHHAGDSVKESAYARLAGEQAAAQFANTEAVRYFSRALEITTDIPYRYAILSAREKVYALQGNITAQEQDLEDLAALVSDLDAPVWEAEVALRQAHHAEVVGDYEKALAMGQRAVNKAWGAGDRQRAAGGYLRWGRAAWLQGNPHQAIPHLRHALALARTAGSGEIEAAVLRSLGVIAYYQGNHEQGKVYFERALEIFRRTGDRRGEAGILNNLGVDFYNRGDYARARVYYHDSLNIFRMVGYRQGEGRSMGNLGIIAQSLGDYEEAETWYAQALHIYDEIGYRPGTSMVLAYRSLLVHQGGKHEEALALAEQALEIAERSEDSLNQGFALTNMGHALAALGNLEEAAAAYRRAADVRQQAGQENVRLESLAGLAEIERRCERLAEAQALVEEVLQQLPGSSLVGAIEPFRVYLACYHILTEAGDARAGELLAEGYGRLQQCAGKITNATLRRSYLEKVAVHRELVTAYEQLTQ